MEDVMKRLIFLVVIFFTMTFSHYEAKPASVSFGIFYSSLRPYGEWIEIDANLFAWRPNSVSWNWKPYSYGRWVWSSHGWYWDSYEPFGWATYHYGRWYYDEYYGWIWIPDYEWGPSWVEWRYDDDYIGWAPLPPYATFRIGVGIHFSIGWNSNYLYWNFVSYHRFCHSRVNYYIIDSRRSHKIFSRTKYRNNYYMDRDRLVNGGLDRNFVERKAGYRIAEREIVSTNDYNRYDRSRNSNSDRIYDYRPSEREINLERYDGNMDIKRGESRSSLKRDKIELNRNSDIADREIKSDRMKEREAPTDLNRNRSEENIRERNVQGRNEDEERTKPKIQNENRNPAPYFEKNNTRTERSEPRNEVRSQRSNEPNYRKNEQEKPRYEPRERSERKVERDNPASRSNERRESRSERQSSENKQTERRR